MKDNLLYKIIGILLVLSIVITVVTTNIVTITGLTLLRGGSGVVVSGGKTEETTAAPAGETYDNSGSADEGQTNADGNVVVTGSASSNETTQKSGSSGGSGSSGSSGGSSGSSGTNKTPNSGSNSNAGNNTANKADYAKILADYTTVVNKVKRECPGYKNNDWQTLENISVPSLTFKALNAAGGKFLETKEQSQEGTHNKGDYPKWFALPSTDVTKVGCVLTDTKAIESASRTVNSDGTTTLKITLVKEKDPDCNTDDPSQCKSAHGRMFDTTSIAPVMAKVTSVGLDPEKCYCTYYGTATLIYDTKSMQCKKLDHIIDVRVFVGEGKEAKITADYHFYDFVW